MVSRAIEIVLSMQSVVGMPPVSGPGDCYQTATARAAERRCGQRPLDMAREIPADRLSWLLNFARRPAGTAMRECVDRIHPAQAEGFRERS